MFQLPENFLAILDVGHGSAAVLRSDAEIAVFDTGENTRLLEFLQLYGIREIKYVFISHADKDHIGGLLGVLTQREIETRNVFLNSDALKGTASWKDLVYELQELAREGEIKWESSLRENDAFSVGASNLFVLSPSLALAATGPGSTTPSGGKVTSNSASAVIKVVLPNKSFLFTGDIDSVGLEEAWENAEFETDVLIYPHHGGKSGDGNDGFTQDLIGRTTPICVIFSNGRHKHKNPRVEVIDQIHGHNGDIQILCTQLSKDCAEQYPDVGAPKEIDSKCRCAGSIIIDLDSGDFISPTLDDFASFISDHVASPMCCEATSRTD